MSMVISHLVWKLRTRKIRERATKNGQTFDESEEGIRWQAQGVDLEEKFRNMFSVRRGNTVAVIEDMYAMDHASVTPKTIPNAVM